MSLHLHALVVGGIARGSRVALPFELDEQAGKWVPPEFWRVVEEPPFRLGAVKDTVPLDVRTETLRVHVICASNPLANDRYALAPADWESSRVLREWKRLA